MQALGEHAAASKCHAQAGDILVAISGSIAPGSAEEAKHRSLQEFLVRATAPIGDRLKGMSMS